MATPPIVFQMSTPNGDPSLGAGDALSSGEAIGRMYRITADHERPFEEKLDAVLALGRAFLGVEAGFLTEISDDTQVIVAANSDHDLLQVDESCPLSQAYCKRTVERDRALTVQQASVEGWEGDAAYDRFGLESYVGAKVTVDGDVYGTFCFADSDPREQPFTETEETFVELLAQWVSYELFNRRATERIERQRDRLEEFASVVSHDLRNPLNVVKGSLDLAEETGDPEHFERCRSGVDRMETMIEDLLALTRQGEDTDESTTVDLAAIARESWTVVDTADARLEVAADLTVWGDESRLHQLFENLFRNAVEHGGEAVTVRVDAIDGGFSVADDGTGLPEDHDRILEDGFTTSADGTGLGLNIVARVAEEHGWTVSVTDSADGGARFEFTYVELVEG